MVIIVVFVSTLYMRICGASSHLSLCIQEYVTHTSVDSVNAFSFKLLIMLFASTLHLYVKVYRKTSYSIMNAREKEYFPFLWIIIAYRLSAHTMTDSKSNPHIDKTPVGKTSGITPRKTPAASPLGISMKSQKSKEKRHAFACRLHGAQTRN